MNRDEAREHVIKFIYSVRRNSLRRIKMRRKFEERHGSIHVALLLESTKKEFDDEVRLIKSFKQKLEDQIDESIGPIEDPDGREI